MKFNSFFFFLSQAAEGGGAAATVAVSDGSVLAGSLPDSRWWLADGVG
jgi:hypothetical protein